MSDVIAYEVVDVGPVDGPATDVASPAWLATWAPRLGPTATLVVQVLAVDLALDNPEGGWATTRAALARRVGVGEARLTEALGRLDRFSPCQVGSDRLVIPARWASRRPAVVS